MPPRRSCFPVLEEADIAPFLVSMPPRRSCFNLNLKGGNENEEGFNATTAFLLRVSPAGEAGQNPKVSMPPRRSCFYSRQDPALDGRFCFNATTAFLLPFPLGYTTTTK